MRDPGMPDPYRTRKWVGLVLWLVGMLIGGIFVLALFVIEPFGSGDPMGMAMSMGLGALLAFPAGLMYLTFPRLLDRFDPEPLWALGLCLLWGAVAACGFAAFINSVGGGIVASLVGGEAGDVFSAVISAPFVEEFWKGIMVVGVAYFLRDEFDGVVDGVIYATFVAIGFAATENVLYYGRVIHTADVDAIRDTVMIRGLLAPWGPPALHVDDGPGPRARPRADEHGREGVPPARRLCGRRAAPHALERLRDGLRLLVRAARLHGVPALCSSCGSSSCSRSSCS
jgi:MFS family permease